jgi:serine phosphatase RsbU (regulator of sigma subunit)
MPSKNASSNQETRLSLRLQKLIEASQKLAQVESVENLVPLLLELVRAVTGAEASSFLIYDPDRHVLRFSTITDEHISDTAAESLKKTIEIPVGEGIAGWVAKERQPLIVEDAQKDSRFFNKVDKSTGFITRSILGVPVLYGDELMGVIEAVNAIDKPCFDSADKELLVSFADLAAVAIFRARLLEERLQQQKMQIQMETAAKIQSLFRPKAPDIGSGSHIWAISEPAKFVGGDLYDVIPMPDNSWLLYVADVSDKGLPAALIMAALWYRIRSEAHQHQNVGALLGKLNKVLYDLLSEEGYFVTIFIAQYWPNTGKLELVSGGHHPALKVSKNIIRNIAGSRGPSLGIDRWSSYNNEAVHLAPGESMLFTTDGVSEVISPRGEFFGLQRIVDCVKSVPRPPRGRRLWESLKEWQAHTEAHDDLTMLEIWRDDIV